MYRGPSESSPKVVLVVDLTNGNDRICDGSAYIGPHDDRDSLSDGQHCGIEENNKSRYKSFSVKWSFDVSAKKFRPR